MDNKPSRLIQTSPRQLLAHILETPELVSAVRALPSRALGKLIEHVGLEDSGDLIALASTDQLGEIFDEDLWQSKRPGQDERFDAERFGLWLEVMLEAGEELVAEKLVELPEDLVTMALQRHILVINIDELMVEMADPDQDYTMLNKALDNCLYQEFGEYQIISKNHHGWDTILSVLLALDQNHHDFLQRLLERCCHLSTEYIDDNGGLYDVLTSEEMLESDLAADREERRATEGYIAPSAAASFLALARTTSLEEIKTQQRDPVARVYFRDLGRRPSSKLTRPTGAPSRTTPPTASTAISARSGEQGAETVSSTSESGLSAETMKLLEVLRRAQVLPEAPPTALIEEKAASGQEHLPLLARVLAAVAEQDQNCYSARMEELAFLANVLIAGGTLAGRSFRALEAAQAVIAVCSLGLEFLMQLPDSAVLTKAQLQRASKTLTEEPADKLFRLGWRLLYETVVLASASRLESVLSAKAGDSNNASLASLCRRMVNSLQAAIKAGKPWMARGRLQELEEAFDAIRLATVQGLIDECPTICGELQNANAIAEQPAGLEREFIGRQEQIKSVANFLAGLV